MIEPSNSSLGCNPNWNISFMFLSLFVAQSHAIVFHDELYLVLVKAQLADWRFGTLMWHLGWGGIKAFAGCDGASSLPGHLEKFLKQNML